MYYLQGQQFEVIMDNTPMQWLQCMKGNNPWLMWLYLALQQYAFIMRCWKGQDHTNADFFPHQAASAYLDHNWRGGGESVSP